MNCSITQLHPLLIIVNIPFWLQQVQLSMSFFGVSADLFHFMKLSIFAMDVYFT